MNAEDIINPATDILQDAGGVTYTDAQLLTYLNDGQLAVSILRPDASQETVSALLATGQTEQVVGGRRLIDVHNNMGVDGATPGDVIYHVERKTKDAFDPGWHSATPDTVIREYIYDVATPKVFWVSPPAHGATAVYVKLTRAIDPATIAVVGDPISLDDIYAPPLQEWILYRAFARDSEDTPNYVRAGNHFNNFFKLLGLKVRPDMAVSAKISEPKPQ